MTSSVFADTLLRNRMAFVRRMDPTELIELLMEKRVLSLCAAETCRAKTTTMSKNAFILDLLPRRGSSAEKSFVESLVESNQRELAALLSPEIELQQPGAAPPVVVKRVFRDLTTATRNLRPSEKTSERGNTVYLTSTTVYSEKEPTSSLGAAEIPFLFAFKSGLYGKEAVLACPNAPSKREFERAIAIYELELAELMTIVRELETGGIDATIRPTDCRLFKLVPSLFKSFLTVDGPYVRLQLPAISTEFVSENDLTVIAAAFHLVCFWPHAFVIRKTSAPKPNAYLLYKAVELVNSPVIMDRDREWITEAVSKDESVTLTTRYSACPW